MQTTSVTELKANLSAQLKRVAAGTPLLVTDRNKPVAVLRPLDGLLSDQRIAGLVATGVIAPANRRLDTKALTRIRRARSKQPLSSAIIEDRAER